MSEVKKGEYTPLSKAEIEKRNNEFVNIAIPTVKLELAKHGVKWTKQTELIVYVSMVIMHRLNYEIMDQHLKDAGVNLRPRAKMFRQDLKGAPTP